LGGAWAIGALSVVGAFSFFIDFGYIFALFVSLLLAIFFLFIIVILESCALAVKNSKELGEIKDALQKLSHYG
jgi:Kef-type K+ transport system membrane component KefB